MNPFLYLVTFIECMLLLGYVSPGFYPWLIVTLQFFVTLCCEFFPVIEPFIALLLFVIIVIRAVITTMIISSSISIRNVNANSIDASIGKRTTYHYKHV